MDLISQVEFITQCIKRLDEWVQDNGWGGYDPYDVKGTPIIIDIARSKSIKRMYRLLLLVFVQLFPRGSRRLFKVRKAVNAKAMALFARGYFNMYRYLKKDAYLEKAITCLRWLMENPRKGHSGYCWGYPFDWWSGGRVLFPAGTPSSVLSSIAGHAFLDGYDILKEESYLKVAESICSFIVNDLNQKVSNGNICFSYTPLDDYEVHNANLWCASLLSRVAFHGKRPLFRKLAPKAVKFTVSEQREDGAWYYWSTRYAHKKGIENEFTIDNYHTGFLIECLMDCDRYIPFLNVKENIKKGADFYVENFILKEGIPKLSPDKVYPIDVHGCAQTIITLTKLSEMNREYLDVGKKVTLWTIRNMQDKSGFFIYRIYRWRVDKTPYIRWGEAWMLKALSDILCQAGSST